MEVGGFSTPQPLAGCNLLSRTGSMLTVLEQRLYHEIRQIQAALIELDEQESETARAYVEYVTAMAAEEEQTGSTKKRGRRGGYNPKPRQAVFYHREDSVRKRDLWEHDSSKSILRFWLDLPRTMFWNKEFQREFGVPMHGGELEEHVPFWSGQVSRECFS